VPFLPVFWKQSAPRRPARLSHIPEQGTDNLDGLFSLPFVEQPTKPLYYFDSWDGDKVVSDKGSGGMPSSAQNPRNYGNGTTSDALT
jgi:hypothetical protein